MPPFQDLMDDIQHRQARARVDSDPFTGNYKVARANVFVTEGLFDFFFHLFKQIKWRCL